jgi:hypothetical protein
LCSVFVGVALPGASESGLVCALSFGGVALGLLLAELVLDGAGLCFEQHFGELVLGAAASQPEDLRVRGGSLIGRFRQSTEPLGLIYVYTPELGLAARRAVAVLNFEGDDRPQPFRPRGE